MPPSGLGPSRSVAADQHRALAHAAHAAALARRRAGSPRPSSSTSSRGRPPASSSRTSARVRAGVAGDVGQRLLGDAVEHELRVGAELGQPGLDVHVDLELGVLGDALAEHAQRAGQAEVVERLGPQPAGDPAHLLEAAARGLLRLQHAARATARARRAATRPSCSTTPVSVWPTPSWSSCATRSRSPSCAASARPTLSRRSASRRSSISLNARGELGRLGVARRRPRAGGRARAGRSGARTRSAARSGASARRSSSRLSAEHQREAAGEDRQLAQRRRSTPRGEKTSAVIVHAAASTAALPMATRQKSAGPRERANTDRRRVTSTGVGHHRHANRSVLEGVWPRARRQ